MNISPVGFQTKPYNINRSNNKNIAFGNVAIETSIIAKIEG